MSWKSVKPAKVEKKADKVTSATITAYAPGKGRQNFRLKGNREQVKEQVDDYKELGYTRVEVRYSDGTRDRL